MPVKICATDNVNKNSFTICLYCFKIFSKIAAGPFCHPTCQIKLNHHYFSPFFSLREFLQSFPSENIIKHP